METITPHGSDPLGSTGPTKTSGPQADPGRVAPIRPVENLLTLIGGTWLVIGLFIDGYAHSEVIDTETEDFFTPWHAIFYSGFLFSSAVVAWIAIRRSSPAPVRHWLPPGYGLAAIGIGVFALGGLGDGIWHTVFGVETGIDALLSPTHLLLFFGMALILTAPLRAAWLDPRHRSQWSDLGGAIASAAITTALVAFFFTYVFGISEIWPQGIAFDPVTEANEELVQIGLSGAYIATMILVVPVLAMLRRWDLPPGGITVIMAVPVLLENLAFDGELAVALPSAIVGGVAVEAISTGLRRRVGLRRHVAITSGIGLGFTLMWSVWMGLAHLVDGVAWMPELWAGQIVMSGFVAVGLAVLATVPQPVEGNPNDSDIAPARSRARV